MVLTINTQRPALEVTVDGETRRWEYDVVTLKIKQQELKDRSGNPEPSLDDLQEFRDYLLSQGMPACNVDSALRIWSLVTVQFQQLAVGIAKQVDALSKVE